jgi:asparagine N-glycosylation enzyme membrane subunit Stt3
MSIWKKLPWFSLLLLLVAYSTLGWVLHDAETPWYLWILVVFAIFLLLELLTAPRKRVQIYTMNLLKSDWAIFAASVLAAFLVAIALVWLHVFVHALVIISAAILVKIDAQTAGLKNHQAFWLLTIFCVTGLSLGAAAEMFISPYISM